MENTARSERSRSALLQAALVIIARDGPGRLTLDAIARESGISKGGLMHQFRTKEAVLKALLEHQLAYFEEFSRNYLAEFGAQTPEPNLTAQIATMRESMAKPNSVGFAILGALAADPGLLSVVRYGDARKAESIRDEAADPDLATLRSYAAMGMLLTRLLGLSELADADRDRLFERLLDHGQWTTHAKDAKERPPAPAGRARKRAVR